MPNRQKTNPWSLATRQNALKAIKSRLDLRIEDENRRPFPDMSRLSQLKRLKLRTKDEITSIQTLIRSLDRSQHSPAV